MQKQNLTSSSPRFALLKLEVNQKHKIKRMEYTRLLWLLLFGGVSALRIVGQSVSLSRVLPGAAQAVEISVDFMGANSADDLQLTIFHPSLNGFTSSSWILTAAAQQDSTDSSVFRWTWTGTLTAPLMEGVFNLVWRVRHVRQSGISLLLSPAIRAPIESSCSDGVFCNGLERLVEGQCVSSVPACSGLSDECNRMTCNEELKTCQTATDFTNQNCTVCCQPDNGGCITVGQVRLLYSSSHLTVCCLSWVPCKSHLNTIHLASIPSSPTHSKQLLQHQLSESLISQKLYQAV